MIIAETDRLLLRNFKESDAAALLSYLGNPRVNCFKSERLSSIEEAEEYIIDKQKEAYSFTICLKESDNLIGDVFAVKEDTDTFNIGWHINQLFEGKGYAHEAARGFLSYLFDIENTRRIYGYVESDNIRSRKLCERLGMRLEGCFKEFISFVENPDGTPIYEDTCVYAILKREWK